ncbi:MAG TPA: FkbM family methyltransferase [Leptolyngbyaceae cyanobacterium M33_DOE_097]|uniref:FkbM family methyltransferase n=1 Tax=Oscillatoriales cyanobacterium SpSt-418 TaxID=2282169 RepID=A0A7C3KBJ1_9CYAN|nr:FkbM family methyltransferase [Leptolyngbyaceae cyanobacterium M33_DOE_097]
MSQSFHPAQHRQLIEVHPETIAPKFEYNNETLNDRWIVEYIFPNRRNGYFVEAGAANGRAASSCYILETELDWTGICIEPNESFFQKLIENRPHSICENVCLADQPGKVTFIQGDGLHSSYLSGIKTNLEQFKSGSAEILQEGAVLEKEAVTLVSLLEKHNAPNVIDYGAFDIEGSELDVLQNFPFDRYRFLALTMECDESVWEQLFPILARYGYRQVSNPFNPKMHWEKYCLHESVEW